MRHAWILCIGSYGNKANGVFLFSFFIYVGMAFRVVGFLFFSFKCRYPWTSPLEYICTTIGRA